MRPDRVVLTGFMGAGKSTIGRLLAPRLGWVFYDVDDHIAEQAGYGAVEIFASHGEAHFRLVEAASVEQLLKLNGAVIALGGGALEYSATRERIATTPGTLLVYLQASLATSVERCGGDSGAVTRPVLADRPGLSTRFAQRAENYRKADISVDTEGLRPDEVVEQVLAGLARASLHSQ